MNPDFAVFQVNMTLLSSLQYQRKLWCNYQCAVCHSLLFGFDLVGRYDLCRQCYTTEKGYLCGTWRRLVMSIGFLCMSYRILRCFVVHDILSLYVCIYIHTTGMYINNPSKDYVAITLDQFRGNWKYNHGDEKFQSFLAETPIYIQWDDHEVTFRVLFYPPLYGNTCVFLVQFPSV